MAKLHVLQTNFITGQLDESTRARSESALYRNGARSLRNCTPYVTGGVRTRPGTWHHATLPGPAVLAEFSFSLSQSYVAAFTEGRVDLFFSDTGMPAGSVAGMPWHNAILRELRFAQLGDVMWIVHASFWPFELRRLAADSFAAAPMTFDGYEGLPTYRYAPAGINAQVGGGIASTITLASNPTAGGLAVAMVPGMLGQARLTAGPGAWQPFTITSVAGLVLGVAWTGTALDAAVGLDVQLDSASGPGTGGTPGGDPAPTPWTGTDGGGNADGEGSGGPGDGGDSGGGGSSSNSGEAGEGNAGTDAGAGGDDGSGW